MARILVAPDSPPQAAQLRLILEAAGFQVVIAPGGRTALDLLATADFDLIVSDVVLPGLSGYDLCRGIKENPARQAPPVILLTTPRDSAAVLRGLGCGADHFVIKPYRPEHLVNRVRRVLGDKTGLGGGSRSGEGESAPGRDFAAAGKEQIVDLLVAACEHIARGDRTCSEIQEALRESEERNRQLFEGNPHVMWAYDPATLDLLAANDAAVERYGYSHAELLAMKATDLFPDEVARLHRELAKPPGRLHHSGVWKHRQKDGALLDMEVTSHEATFAGRSARVVLAVDVTGRRRLEERLRQSEKMEAVGRLAGGVAHDFNNLLTVINGYGELALRSLPMSDPTRELVREMVAAGDRAAQLTRQLLAFSRHQVVEPKVLHLDAEVGEAEKMLRRLVGEDVDLVVLSDKGLAPVLADPGHVQQVLINLCANARDAMPKGGRLTIETRNVELDEAQAAAHPGARPGPHVLLAVSDTGHGMTEEVKARVFEPFFTTKEAGKGTGIGLATVYGVVRQSRGHISIHTKVGQGATFKVYFPRAPADAPREGAKSKSTILRGARGKETVLLAEDDDSVRALTRRVLQGAGYTVLEGRDGMEALGVCRRHPGAIHLVISDVVMPRLGGRELADQLAALRPGIKILFLSGYTEEAVVRHGVLEAEVQFLQKPFYPTVLAQKVREVLDSPE